jgi:putative oxidoreductase
MFKFLFPRVGADQPLPQRATNAASVILRVGLAAIFLYHGLGQKILPEGAEWGANWLIVMFDAPPASLEESPALGAVQLGVAWGEVVGGLALALGLLTRLAACGLILIQGAAAYFTLLYQPFSLTKAGGPEYNLALLAMCAAVLILGGGRFSADCLLLRGRREGLEATPAPRRAAPDLVSTAQR